MSLETDFYRQFIRDSCECCTKENDCSILFDFLCEQEVAEWQEVGGVLTCTEFKLQEKTEEP